VRAATLATVDVATRVVELDGTAVAGAVPVEGEAVGHLGDGVAAAGIGVSIPLCVGNSGEYFVIKSLFQGKLDLYLYTI
jgi:membrane-associated protease RseP (regulator of RpoE activity)